MEFKLDEFSGNLRQLLANAHVSSYLSKAMQVKMAEALSGLFKFIRDVFLLEVSKRRQEVATPLQP